MINRKPFTMLEMVCALALTVVLLALFATLQSRMKQAGESFSRETAAVLAVQNTLQRVKLLKEPDVESTRRIFLEEAAFAGDFEPRITEEAGELKLALLNRRNNAATVEVSLKCAE